jgi:hypothetical protein
MEILTLGFDDCAAVFITPRNKITVINPSDLTSEVLEGLLFGRYTI